ncbi:MAG TPA: NUDIX hydrolase [Caulobacteraceae bacterium]|nr:NUDIX hydrolase [Caulobacteraceae bacterium]
MKAIKTTGIQYAALPYRVEGGHLRVLLITSRETHRWVIPKGWPMNGLKPQDAAAVEAAEEAGLIGEIEARPLGSYRYLKRLKKDEAVAVQVIVFPFRVEAQVESWKEQDQRSLQWFGYRTAANRVSEPSLKRLIREFGAERSTSLMARGLRRYRAWRAAAAA